MSCLARITLARLLLLSVAAAVLLSCLTRGLAEVKRPPAPHPMKKCPWCKHPPLGDGSQDPAKKVAERMADAILTGQKLDYEPQVIEHTYHDHHTWVLMGLPLPPNDPNPAYPPNCPPGPYPDEVMYIVELGRCLTPAEIAACSLTRYDPVANAYVTYDEHHPQRFGPMNNRDGYWFNMQINDLDGWTLRYEVAPRDDENKGVFRELPLYGPGWNLSGCPWLTGEKGLDVDSTMVKAMDGAELRRYMFCTCVMGNPRNWLQDPFFCYDSASASYQTVGCDEKDQSYVVKGWYGYWLYTLVPQPRWLLPTIPPPPHND